MRISELSREAGVSVASIKFYLREGLLPAGAATAANQAAYGDDHVRRLRLIRALMEVGELSVARVRNVLGAVDDSEAPLHTAFGEVMHGLAEAPSADPPERVLPALQEVHAWIRRRGWAIAPEAPAPFVLAGLITTLREFGLPASIGELDAAADAALVIADTEVQFARAMPDRTAAVETMLIGTVGYERAFAEVRRIVLEATSAAMDAGAHAEVTPRKRGRATRRAAR